MKRITVLLVDDNTMVRAEFRKMLELEADFDVVGEAQDGRQAVVLTEKLRPDVVLMDIAMPQFNGLEATRQIAKAMPATKVLILSAHGDYAYVSNAIECGAAGYLLKRTSAHDVCRAIREVQMGKTFFRPSIARHFNRRNPPSPGRAGAADPKAAKLTSREREVLRLIAEGKASQETADELGLSLLAVEQQRERLMTKLGLHDTAGLTRYAISVGISEGGVQLTIV